MLSTLSRCGSLASMDTEGTAGGSWEKRGKRPASEEGGASPPTRVVRVEDLQSLVEGIVDRALAKKATTGTPPSDGGSKCRTGRRASFA